MNNIKDYFSEDFLKKYDGKNLVVYFYPKDNTPGCTTEAINFTERIDDFEALNTEVVGISKDSDKTHENFKNKHDLKIDLVSDKEKVLHEKFDVIKQKKLYGKEVMGTERSTFVFNKAGELIKEYRKVKVKGHVDEVYDFLKGYLDEHK
ncbi:peroxiredoxin [Miniphocaeibacter massiliensis]|uniref:peroxiredoxin n=1 Tax=Miniphocaeibacter massiliensis TaxID=2041841 RepID=UPI000C072A61|nr:peroxiredoxin [Miniphocaeibacter massiliensis]